MDLDKIAAQIAPWLRKFGTLSERNLVIGDDIYKPTYRAVSILFAFQKDIEGLTRNPTLEEATEILRRAHPYFTDVAGNHFEEFEEIFKFHLYAWS